MLALEYRPRTFAQMAGQDLVKKSLLHISQDPENAPQTILLEGKFGTGKTTAARIFARALNCPNKLPNGDACGRDDCPICGKEIQDSIFYSEYDAAIVGRVETIREMRDTFYFGYANGYRVIVFDEVHLTSDKAQGALLKILEEPNPHVFYLLCTTDPQKLLNTIVSRSLELRYTNIEPKDMIPFLRRCLESNNVEITPQIETNLSLIARHSRGHMRNAMMLLDSMLLLKEDFTSVVRPALPIFAKLFAAALRYKSLSSKFGTAEVDNLINDCIENKLSTIDLSTLTSEYTNCVLQLSKLLFTPLDQIDKENYSSDLVSIAQLFHRRLDIIDILNDYLVYRGFTDDRSFQIQLYVLLDKLKKVSV